MAVFKIRYSSVSYTISKWVGKTVPPYLSTESNGMAVWTGIHINKQLKYGKCQVWVGDEWRLTGAAQHCLWGVTKHRTVCTGPKYSDILHWISSKSNKPEMHENRNLFFFLIEINNIYRTIHILPIPRTCIWRRCGRCGRCGVSWHRCLWYNYKCDFKFIF